jgi:hypothetical protein
MRDIGIINVHRWLTEDIDEGVKAYMESEGRLYPLVSVTGINGAVGVTLEGLFPGPTGRFKYTAGAGTYSLNSPVFLSKNGRNLTSEKVTDIVEEGAEEVSTGMSGMPSNSVSVYTVDPLTGEGTSNFSIGSQTGANLQWCG